MDRTLRFTCTMITSLMTIMMLWAGCARAEVVGFTSSVVWRADDEGDYVIPETRNGVCAAREGVSTDGLVEKITVAWKSDSAVKLEVSADSGRNYYEVVNGVPLAGKFLTGDRIKWRAYLDGKSLLTQVTVKYVDSFDITAGFGEPELSGFKYRKRIDISGSDVELYNYQVKIKVGESIMSKGSDVDCEGNLKKNFSDIRFTTFDGETIIPYYLEKVSGNTPESVAEFWVKIPQIPTEGVSLYVYYSNAEAESLSSAEDVFEKAEDGTTDSTLKRKYADVEPVVIKESESQRVKESRSQGGIQEEVEMPVFRGTTLSKKGDVVLKDGYEEGEYISIKTRTAFPVRILVPALEGENITMDISADGGKTYRENCGNNVYYYASKKDFLIGTRPLIKARLKRAVEKAELEEIELDYEPGSITLISPNGSEEWIAGTMRDILWSALEYDFFYPVKLEYSVNGGIVYNTITDRTDNDGIYTWHIPRDIVSREVFIRVSDANDEEVNDVSDGRFIIQRGE